MNNTHILSILTSFLSFLSSFFLPVVPTNKRVEAIMSRTRKAQGNKPSFPDSDGSRTPDSNDASPVRTIEESKGVGFQSIYLDVRD